MVIIGFVLVLVIPLTILYAKYSSESSYAVTTSKIDSISKEIIAAANQVNVYGKDTQVKLNLDFPKDIKSVSFSGNEIIFVVKKGNEDAEIAKVADVSFSFVGNIPVTPGKKNVIVKSLGNSVLVNIACHDSDIICAPETFSSCGASSCLIECKNNAWAIKENCANSCNNNQCS